MDILTTEARPTFLGIRRSAWLEMGLFFTLLLVIDSVFGSGQRFQNVYPHPCWIILLLITVQYGAVEGLVCAVLSVLFLYAGAVPEQSIAQTTYMYAEELSRRPLMWLATAVLLGELSARQIRRRKETEAALQESRKEGDTITAAYQRIKSLKEALEVRLAGELRSSLTIFESAKALENLDQNEILLESSDVIDATMHPEKFSLYALGGQGFEPVFCHGWEEQDRYERRFTTASPLYQAIASGERALCIINPEDERILTGEGILAGPLISNTTGEVYGMLKIESLGFMELNVHNIETFKVLCEWIGAAYSNAKRYQQAEAVSMQNHARKLYSSTFLRRQTTILQTLAQAADFPLSKVVIRIVNTAKLSEQASNQIASRVSDALSPLFSTMDMAFDDGTSGTSFVVLLPNHTVNEARARAEKYAEALCQSWKDEPDAPRFTLAVHAITPAEQAHVA